VKFLFKDSQLLLPSCCRKKKLLSDAMVAAMLLSHGAAAAAMVAAAPLLQQQRQQSLGWSTGGKQWYGSGSFSRNKNCSLQDKLTKPSPRRYGLMMAIIIVSENSFQFLFMQNPCLFFLQDSTLSKGFLAHFSHTNWMERRRRRRIVLWEKVQAGGI
jgi:hypothetical protein